MDELGTIRGLDSLRYRATCAAKEVEMQVGGRMVDGVRPEAEMMVRERARWEGRRGRALPPPPAPRSLPSVHGPVRNGRSVVRCGCAIALHEAAGNTAKREMERGVGGGGRKEGRGGGGEVR